MSGVVKDNVPDFKVQYMNDIYSSPILDCKCAVKGL